MIKNETSEDSTKIFFSHLLLALISLRSYFMCPRRFCLSEFSGKNTHTQAHVIHDAYFSRTFYTHNSDEQILCFQYIRFIHFPTLVTLHLPLSGYYFKKKYMQEFTLAQVERLTMLFRGQGNFYLKDCVSQSAILISIHQFPSIQN